MNGITVTTEAPSSPLKSPQVQQWLIIAALLACLLIGGGIIYWFVFAGSGGTTTVKVDPAKQKPRAMRVPEMPGITRLGTERWTVRGSAGSVDIKRSGEKFQFDYQFLSGYQPSPLLLAASRATRDAAMAQEWGVTRDQAKQIRAEFDKNEDFSFTSSEITSLTVIWERYLAAADTAARNAASKDMQQKIDEIVKAKLQKANDALARNDRRIREILPPETIDKMVKK